MSNNLLYFLICNLVYLCFHFFFCWFLNEERYFNVPTLMFSLSFDLWFSPFCISCNEMNPWTLLTLQCVESTKQHELQKEYISIMNKIKPYFICFLMSFSWIVHRKTWVPNASTEIFISKYSHEFTYYIVA